MVTMKKIIIEYISKEIGNEFQCFTTKKLSTKEGNEGEKSYEAFRK